jgi:hypothetical protein
MVAHLAHGLQHPWSDAVQIFIVELVIDLAMDTENALTEDEAAYMSTLRYIVKWMVEQVIPTREWNN